MRKCWRKRAAFQLFLFSLSSLPLSSVISAWTSPGQALLLRHISTSSITPWDSQICSSRQCNRRSGLPLAVKDESQPAPLSVATVKGKGEGSGSIRVQRKKRKQKVDMRSIKHTFQKAKRLERQGKWVEACIQYEQILERAPHDAHSHLGLARLEARRERKLQNWATLAEDSVEGAVSTLALSRAQAAFDKGTRACPESVHLWQAWAVYEQSRGNPSRARELFEEALILQPHNPYVCHAYGLMEKQLGDGAKAVRLFDQALVENSTAALVCSLGEILIADENLERARDLYADHLSRLKTEKDKIEVLLASAWLEERNFKDYDRAQQFLKSALDINPGSSIANVALARLEGRIQRSRNKNGVVGKRATAEMLANVCREIEKNKRRHSDGRVFNTLASLQVQNRRYIVAREVLRRGIDLFRRDHTVSSFCNSYGRPKQRY
jgi:tetratricopeptide (TPR) repeat protein